MSRRRGDDVGNGREDLAERFKALSPWLERKLAVRLGAQPADVQDIVQESFIRLGRYSVPDRSRHPRALLLRIAGNIALDGHRSALVRGHGLHDRLEDVAPERLCQGSSPELVVDLKRAILALAPPLREVFLLSRFTPLSNRQIAERLGISVKTVEWRLAKALAFCLNEARDERVDE